MTERDEFCSLDGDLVLEIEIYGFETRPDMRKAAILVERRTPLPCDRKGIFLDKVKVPLGGKVSLNIHVAGRRNRTVIETKKPLDWRRWWHCPLGIYNQVQDGVGQVPLVGKLLERIAPDAWAKYSFLYQVCVSQDGVLDYAITAMDKQDRKQDSTEDASSECVLCKGTFLL